MAHRLVKFPDATTTERIAWAVEPLVSELRDTKGSTLAAIICSVRIGRAHVVIQLDRAAVADRLAIPPDWLDDGLLAFEAPFSIRRRGIETKIIAGSLATAADPNLRKTLLSAHRWLTDLKANRSIAEIARVGGHSESYIRTRLPLALLLPRIQGGILDGSIGPTMTVDSIVHADLPSDWTAQEKHLGYSSI